MNYDVIETTAGVLKDHFATDLTAILAAKSLQELDAKARIYKRLPAAVIRELNRPLPAIGVYWAGLVTQAQSQRTRDSNVTVVLDYVARRRTDPEKLEQQVELASEAILRTIDRLAGQGTILGAGEVEGGVQVQIFRDKREKAVEPYVMRAQVTFVARDRDTVL